MGALRDAPRELLAFDLVYFVAYVVGGIVVPLYLVARESNHCDGDDDESHCATHAASSAAALLVQRAAAR